MSTITIKRGQVYGLIGPNGAGKTTFFNVITGLYTPDSGTFELAGKPYQPTAVHEVAQAGIARTFQNLALFKSMTVRENLAFPLRNRRMKPDDIARRVNEVLDLVSLTALADRRARGLTADEKQKISLGRGLVRPDVNAILFDEPLTVIDPHMKWELRTQLKQLHRQFGHTMIYVTHDQTEALTFADQVVVMNLGEVVQAATPVELFERPQHTFVGHFIGSPGMNVLPCEVRGGKAMFAGIPVEAANIQAATSRGRTEIGVRPEFVSIAKSGIAAEVVRVADAGRYRIVEARSHGHTIKLLLKEGDEVPQSSTFLAFDPTHARV